MEEKKLHKQVKELYQDINNKWLYFHLRLLTSCIIIVAVMEIIVFFIIFIGNTLDCTINEYLIKYIIIPIALMSFITGIAYFVFSNKKIKINSKQHMISLLFAIFAFVLSLAHSGFVAILVCAVFPILMTVMYENKKLTTKVAIFCAISQFISGYTTFWDPYKVVNSYYFINMIILIAATFCTWLTCYSMIKFMKVKREIIINNDMERYRLQEKVNIDGLTGIGNKLALLERIEGTSKDINRINYLVMMDVDDFKQINDTYGHIFGDDVIRCIGYAMQKIRSKAEPFRYGGDEFCILFEEQVLEIVILELKKIQQYLMEHIKLEDKSINVFVSAGITIYSKEKTLTELLREADAALYESKKQRNGQITIFKEENQ